MAIIPQISLDVKNPVIEGPLESTGKALALKSMLDSQAMNQQMMRLREQEINENTVKAQDLQRAQRGRQVFSDAMTKYTTEDPEVTAEDGTKSGGGFKTDKSSVINHLIRNGFPDVADAVDKNWQEIDKQKNETLKNKLENSTKILQGAATGFDGIEDIKDPAQQAAAYQAAVAAAAKLDNGQGIVPKMPAQYDQGAVDNLRKIGTTHDQKLADMNGKAAREKEAAEALNSTAQGVAKTRETEAQTIKTFSDPEVYHQWLVDDKTGERAKLWGTDMKEAKNKANQYQLKPATGVPGQQLQEFLDNWDNNPEYQKYPKNANGFAKMQEQTKSDIAGEQTVKTQTALKKGEAKGTAYEDVASGRMQQYQTEESKGRTAYNKTKETTNVMGDFIKAAEGGNKVAFKALPLEGALEITTSAGTTRINRVDVDQYAHAGSAWDKILGKLGGLTEGADIDKSVLKDMGGINTIMKRTNQDRYFQDRKDLDKQFKSKNSSPEFFDLGDEDVRTSKGGGGGASGTAGTKPPLTEAGVAHLLGLPGNKGKSRADLIAAAVAAGYPNPSGLK